jgi:hypothetical protein
MIMRSKVLKHYLDFQSSEKFVRRKFDQEFESLNNALKTFNLLIKSCVHKFFQEIESLKSTIFDFRSPENFCRHTFDQEIHCWLIIRVRN